MGQRKCRCCGEFFKPRKNIPGQNYCGKAECRRYRRAAWQREKLGKDTDYRENQKAAQRLWREKNPGYMAAYRLTHPDYRERERERRCSRRIAAAEATCKTASPLCAVKMDSSPLQPPVKSGIYRIVSTEPENAVKMDSWVVQLTVLAADMKLTGAP
jgi:hypothetical protein